MFLKKYNPNRLGGRNLGIALMLEQRSKKTEYVVDILHVVIKRCKLILMASVTVRSSEQSFSS